MTRAQFWCLALVLTTCTPAVGPSAFLCTVSRDCSPGWFCATDKHCHDGTGGEPLSCASDADCGGSWHCGKEKLCYPLQRVTDAFPCRRDDGTIYGDCGTQFRCGVGDECHPIWDAGAIRCSYEADFDDCTNRWRCSFAGVCLDPAEEALEPYTRQLDAGKLIANILPAAQIAAISQGDTRLSAVAILDDAGVLQLFRRTQVNGPMGGPTRVEDFTAHKITVTRFALSGEITAPITTTNEIVTFFRDGALSRARFDGGWWVIRTDDGGTITNVAGAGPRTVSELRPLASDRLAAFRVGGGGYWTISPDGGSSWTSRTDLVEVLEFPVPSADVGSADSGSADSGSVLNCELVGMGLDASVQFEVVGPNCPQNQFQVDAYERGRLQVGLTGAQNGLLASVKKEDRMGAFGQENELRFFPGPTESTELRCDNVCAGGQVEQLWPYELGPGEFRAELLCAPPDGGGDRWWSIFEPGDFRCMEQHVDKLSRQFFDAHLDHPRGPANSGNYGRYQANLETGNGQAWVRGPGTNSFLEAEPWFVDRPPLALGAFTIGRFPDGGFNRVVLSSNRNTTGALTTSGFLSETQALGIVSTVITADGGVVGFTLSGELSHPLTGLVMARVSLFPFPQEAEQHAIVAPRAQGAEEWVVSVNDQLFTGRVSTTGRVVDLLPAARPDPGFNIISLTAGNKPVDSPTVEFYAATRLNVYRVHLDELNRWRVEPINLGTISDLVEIWTTPSNRLRVGDRLGKVFSLPSGLELAAGRGLNAEDFLTTCGRDVALFTDDAYVLGPVVDGKAEWLPLGLIRNQFKGGRLYEIDDGFLAFGARGEVQRVHCSP